MGFLTFLGNNWELLLSLTGSIIAGVITIIKLVKTNKLSTIKYGTLGCVMAGLPDHISMAEKIHGLDGPAKKSYVMNQVQLELKSAGVIITTGELESLSDMVDNLVALSKSINTHINTQTPSNGQKVPFIGGGAK